jgi:uncharacterized protein (DUF305 family)
MTTTRAIVVLAATLISSAAGAQGAKPQAQINNPAAAKAYDSANVAMMKSVGAALSGDSDRDFVTWMIPHHQGAIAMAEVELQYGKDASLLDMARKIIDEQEKGVATMSQGAASVTPKDAIAGGSLVAYQKATQTMTIKMNVSPVGDPDRDFVMLMLPQLEGGLSVAKAEMQFGKDAGLKEVAKGIAQINPPRIAIHQQWQVGHQL